MRTYELPHSATVYPVKQTAAGVTRYNVDMATAYDVDSTGSSVRCKFTPADQLRLEQRGLNLEISGLLSCAAQGTAERTVRKTDGTGLVVLDGSEVVVRGKRYVVEGVDPAEDLRGRIHGWVLKLKGPIPA